MFRFFKKELTPEQEKSKAYVIYAEWGPKARIDRLERLSKKFPNKDENEIKQWIKEFKFVESTIWKCAEKGGEKAFFDKSLERVFLKEYPWMQKNAIRQAGFLTRYYAHHEGYDRDENLVVSKKDVFVLNLENMLSYLYDKKEDFWRKKLDRIYDSLKYCGTKEETSELLNELKGYFGGMGSFNDLYFEDDAEEFEELKSKLFDSLTDYIVIVRTKD